MSGIVIKGHGATATIRRCMPLAICLVLAGCASQPQPVEGAPALLEGVLHGFLAIMALVLSPFLDTRIYAYPNAGFTYDLGFSLGFAASLVLALLSILPFVGGYFARKG